MTKDEKTEDTPQTSITYVMEKEEKTMYCVYF